MMRLGLLCGGVVLVADQASKYWILNGLDLPALGSIALLPVLNFTMVWNHGVTFGMFNGLGRTGPLLLTLVAVVVVALLLAWMRRARTRLVAGALGAIAGGAIGNVIDRLRFGAGCRLHPRARVRMVVVRVQCCRRGHRLRCRRAAAGQPAGSPSRGHRRAGSGPALEQRIKLLYETTS